MKKRLAVMGRTALLILLVMVAFLGGIYFDRGQTTAFAAPGDQTTPPDFTVFTRVWNLVFDRYVDRKAIDPQKMMYGAISGMLDTLGDTGHTHFSPPSEARANQQDLQGQFEGIGATVGTRDGQVIISSPMPGSPAERAGIRAGDAILQVDGVSVAGMSLDQVISRVRGPKDTSVRLTVLHPGDSEPVDIAIVRGVISVPKTSWAMIPGTKIAHIRLYQFNNGLSRETRQAIDDAKAAGAVGLIIDVRDNPGGLLNEAVDTTSLFLKGGNVLLEQDSTGKQTPFATHNPGLAADLPAVVLVNYGTASAAEILAGALQDSGQATIIGTRTFGTGTVLSTFRMTDGSELLLGTAEWLTPNGHFIKGNGIQPDQTVRLPAGALTLLPEREKDMTVADFQANTDAQVQAAVKLLSQKLQAMPESQVAP